MVKVIQKDPSIALGASNQELYQCPECGFHYAVEMGSATIFVVLSHFFKLEIISNLLPFEQTKIAGGVTYRDFVVGRATSLGEISSVGTSLRRPADSLPAFQAKTKVSIIL